MVSLKKKIYFWLSPKKMFSDFTNKMDRLKVAFEIKNSFRNPFLNLKINLSHDFES
jgi:hypothetical protein